MTITIKVLVETKGVEPSASLPQPFYNETPTKTTENVRTHRCAQIPDFASPDLAEVVAAWALLAEPLKAAILAIVRTVHGGGHGNA